jgi:hypothetical protein
MANIYGYSSLDEALSVLEEDYNKSLKRTPTLYFSEEGLRRFINTVPKKERVERFLYGKKINSRNIKKVC